MSSGGGVFVFVFVFVFVRQTVRPFVYKCHLYTLQ